jgi:hypothetical protein
MGSLVLGLGAVVLLKMKDEFNALLLCNESALAVMKIH